MKRRLTFLIGSMLSVAALLWALSSGPLSAGLGVNVAGADVDWATPTNIYVSDDARATSALAASQVTDLLRSTTYGFAIPAGSAIDGWVAEFERSKSGAGTCEDFSVRAVKAGAEVGAENAVAGAWPGADAYLTYGNATYKWGTTWTAAEVNAVGFGVSIAAQETTGVNPCTARVDHVRITVYYTPSSGRKAFIINVGSLLPASVPEAFVIGALPTSQTREGYISGNRRSGAVDCTVVANRMFDVVNKPVAWVRGNLTALAGGAAPAVTLQYLGVR